MSESNERTGSSTGLGWRVLLASMEGIQPIELAAGDEVRLGPSVRLHAGADGTLEIEVEPGTGQTLLNDVQLSGSSTLRAGDQVRIGEMLALVQGVSELATRPIRHPWCAEHFAVRLGEELDAARGRGEGGALFLVQLAHAERDERGAVMEAISGGSETVVFGELGPDTLQLWADVRAVERVQARLRALEAEAWVARVGMASFPEDAFVREGLVDRALRRLWSTEGLHDELLVQDPMMVRLHGLMDRVATADAPVLLVGEAGVGKTRWALQIHQRSGRRTAPFTRVSCLRIGAEALTAQLEELGRGNGTIVLEQIEALDEAAQRSLLEHWPTAARVIATSEAFTVIRDPRAVLIPGVAERLSPITLSIPSLRDRPSEIVPLAMQALQQARGALGRMRMTLTAEARRALQQYPWPGNVRELRNAVRLSALVAESEEVRLENLPAAVQRGLNAELENGADLRSAMKATEKDALLKVLARTRWNVTAAARELGLPRRTVVYRMSRLGLKRPAR